MNHGSGVWLFLLVFTPGFHSDLVSECLAVGPVKMLWLRWETLFWFVCTLLYVKRAAYPRSSDDIIGDDLSVVTEAHAVWLAESQTG